MDWRGAPVRCLCIAGAVAAAGATLGCATSGNHDATVELIARAPERGNWSRQAIRVERGRRVTIVVRNTDVVTHGFYLPALGLHLSEIKAGDVRRMSFTPEVAGTYPFYCSVWCGDYHMQMRGELIVE